MPSFLLIGCMKKQEKFLVTQINDWDGTTAAKLIVFVLEIKTRNWKNIKSSLCLKLSRL